MTTKISTIENSIRFQIKFIFHHKYINSIGYPNYLSIEFHQSDFEHSVSYTNKHKKFICYCSLIS